MNAVFFLANFYTGPLQGQGHRQQARSGDLGHPWHWLKETDHGWESTPLVAGKAQHFEIAPQAIRHARDHGFDRIQDYICRKAQSAVVSPLL